MLPSFFFHQGHKSFQDIAALEPSQTLAEILMNSH